MFQSIVLISVGASCGAVLRWLLGNRLNALFPSLPLGTLVANLLGGYLIGVAIAVFAIFPAVPAELRLALVTGFLGGLTTFSTFSAEVTQQLQTKRFRWAGATIAAHVGGSLLMTMAGISTVLLVHRL